MLSFYRSDFIVDLSFVILRDESRHVGVGVSVFDKQLFENLTVRTEQLLKLEVPLIFLNFIIL